jgi:hypothetical protein
LSGDQFDGPLSLAEFRAREAQARAECASMMAQCAASGDVAGLERARAFEAMIDRAVRVAIGGQANNS